MKNNRRTWSIIVLALIIIAVVIGIAVPKGSHSSSSAKKGTTITIGSKDFSESKTVMQIWTDALRKEGYTVKTRPNI